jgi:ribosomal protein S12 methylthiotransferase accessory factor
MSLGAPVGCGERLTRPRFALVGTGLLADAVAGALAGHGRAERVGDADLASLDASYTLLVTATDEWDTSGYPGLRQACATAGLPWLPVRAELGSVVVGPLERPGVPGCVDCLHTRRGRARLDPGGGDAVWQRHAPVLAKTPSSWLIGLGCHTAAALVAGTAAALAADAGRPGLLDHAAVFVDLEGLTATRHRFLPEPLCGACGRLPDDTPELAKITLASRPKPAPGTYRVRAAGVPRGSHPIGSEASDQMGPDPERSEGSTGELVEELDSLVGTYVDDETGMIRSMQATTAGGLAVAVAPMPLRVANWVENGYGRTRSYRTSRLVALLEALERWGGMQPGGRRTVIQASYAELTAPALDPRTLGVHPAESYQLPGFSYRPFTEDEVSRWVWGYSFARRAPILVPETVAYYSSVFFGGGEQDRPFAYETSNGCALGSCLEEAILHGILEVAERDAFLLTWYTRMPVPRIDLRTARDRAVPLQAAAITAETGYDVSVYDTTVEQGIPCVWAMATHPGDDPGQARAACAGGAHPDAETAVLEALSELGPVITDVIRRFPDRAGTARRMAADPTLVTTMLDHSLLYSAGEAFARLDFLTTTPGVRSLADMRTRTRGTFGTTGDLRDDLAEALRRYLDTGLDVIVIDQTTPEHRVGGFTCVKVIIPGMVPMTFGHRNRRLDGLPRLYEIPHRLGYRPRPLTPDELVPHPHPFP